MRMSSRKSVRDEGMGLSAGLRDSLGAPVVSVGEGGVGSTFYLEMRWPFDGGPFLHLAPLAGRGRIASPDAIRVRGYRSIDRAILAREPLTPPSPRKRGAREACRPCV